MKLNRRNIKRKSITEFVVIIAIVLLVNYISTAFFFRIDLTSEKRYSISQNTKELLKKLNDVVYVKVYLTGSLPAGFKRLENSIREMLDEFKVYCNDNIEYEFIDPHKLKDKKQQDELFRQLYRLGLNPTNLQEKDNEGKVSQKVIFPGALITYKSNEIPVDFLKSNLNKLPEENLNSSVEEIEYSLVNAVRKLNNEFGQRIAFIEGHGELPAENVEDIAYSLNEYYPVSRVRIDGKLNSLTERVEDSAGFRVRVKYELLIIAKPDSVFNEEDKYIIDQYLMYGGKILWLVDPVDACIDSLAYQSSILATIKNHNIENDMLFKYGVRVNPTLLQDVQCAVIPVNTSVAGAPPQFSPVPWVYFPLLQPSHEHPVGRNVNLVKGEFVSGLDMAGENQEIKKTVLLTTSQYTRIMNAPVRIGLEIIREKLEPRLFGKSHVPVAILLEGKFSSIYINRLTPEFYESKPLAFKDKSYDTRMVVIGDGDMIKNGVQRLGTNKKILPLGYDRYTGENFGNKEFLMNVINYLIDSSGSLDLRSREVKLRLLDRAKTEKERTFWQVVNLTFPVAVIFIAGITISFLRKRKFSKLT